jgi:hypothetical protein
LKQGLLDLSLIYGQANEISRGIGELAVTLITIAEKTAQFVLAPEERLPRLIG